MAPELAQRHPYDSKVDIWALGVLIHIILAGVAPFPGKDSKRIFRGILNDVPSLAEFSKYHQQGKFVKDFIKKCLTKNAQDRATAEELLQHPWIKIMVDQESVDSEQKIDIALNIYTFKKASLLQSSVIAFLSRLKSNNEELA